MDEPIPFHESNKTEEWVDDGLTYSSNQTQVTASLVPPCQSELKGENELYCDYELVNWQHRMGSVFF